VNKILTLWICILLAPAVQAQPGIRLKARGGNSRPGQRQSSPPRRRGPLPRHFILEFRSYPGLETRQELARRGKRLAEIARAKATIEARAKQRHAREQAEYEAKLAARAARTAATGKKPGGRPPAPPVEGPLPTDQVNLTDEESRIMPVPGGGFEQCYNAQAVVAADSLLVVATDPRLRGDKRGAGAERQAAA